MSHPRNLIACALVTVGLTFVLAATPQEEASWVEVQAAINQGLPKTAIEKLQPIISKAMSEKKYAEAIRAISMRIALEGNIQGNKPEEKITRMRAEIEKAPDEMKPAMEAILANWFWHYFQQNRWRFMQRTQTAAAPGDDFTTWDLPRILSETDKQFQRSLENRELLKTVPVADYDALLEKGNAPDTYRPTLFDVLAHSALEFYSAGEQAASRTQDAFDLSADSPIFSSADDFLRWEPTTEDEDSLTLRAIQLYQELLRFHEPDDDRSAFLDADLLRLRFGHNRAFGEEKTARYKAALRRMADEHADHVISTRALYYLATVVQGEGDWVEAHKIASEGMNRFPDSAGGRLCHDLIQQIEARSLRVTTERVWNDPRPTIDVHYRNLKRIHFRIVRLDFQAFVQSNRWQPDQMNRDQRRALLTRPSIRSWASELPETTDYQERTERIPSPDDLPSGSYFLIASHNAEFNDVDNQVSFTEIWESDLAIVTRNQSGRGIVDGFVLDAVSGDPIVGATVRVWQRTSRNRLSSLPDLRTDRNGMFTLRGDDRRQQLVILAEHDGQTLSSGNYLQPYLNQSATQYEQTMFFTDRSLYRPGQTIRYKGICLAVDQERDRYNTIPRRKVTVLFSDVNGQEIERVEHQTNDYGSFSGSVTAPRDRLMGRMSLRIEGTPGGSTQFNVEEYKRPKFQVELDRPKIAARLNQEVKLQGKATAYTGAAIDGAKVRWRVVRRVRYPRWWAWRCWWMPPADGRSEEIAHGTSTTAANGTFEVTFNAKPDVTVPEESEPTFQYTISADITDSTGETRSAARNVSVGFTALAASITADNWLTDNEPVELQIRTTTLDGEGQKASGTLTIYEVEQPEQVTRQPLSSPRYRYRADEQPEPDPTNPNSWSIGESVYETKFETKAGGAVTVSTKLSAGMYRVKLATTDRFGKAVTAELPLQVLDPEADKLNLKLPNLYASPRNSVEPGDEYIALWGSGYSEARAFIEVQHRGRLLQSYWTEPGATQNAIKQQVTDAMRGGFNVRTTMVRENRAYMQSHQVDVPWSNKRLTLRWEHVVSKLEPAAKETWTAIISGPNSSSGEQSAPLKEIAEMVATMYDASLDAYQPHQWPAVFNVFRRDYSYVRSTFENRLKNLGHIYRTWTGPSRRGSELSYRRFPAQIIQNFYGYDYMRRSRMMRGMMAPSSAADGFAVEAAPAAMAGEALSVDFNIQEMGDKSVATPATAEPEATPLVDLDNVSARKNLNETAFFFPHLVAGKDGVVKLEFTMPEALTEWKFMGFAHDRELRAGLLTGKTVTAKDLMVQPNPPRFLREGDVIEFTVKVSNQSPTRQTGSVRLSLNDARTNDSVDELIGNVDRDKAFEIAAGESMSLSWRLNVPDGLGMLTYKAVGSTGRLSDGEEGFLPVLSRRILVTESLPLPIRGKQSKNFEFTKLMNSDNSDTLKHQSLTVQMVSNPSWYAVMALPYLMEYPHECTEQTFNRLYANALARHIAGNDPKIQDIFQQWRNTPALDSPLEKNEEIKAVMIEETPWFRQAMDESQARRNVGILFEDNRLNDEAARNLFKLTQMQLPDGAWPWFPGGRANDYITLYITTGFGRLRHLGVDIDTSAAVKSLTRLDGWATRLYENIPESKRSQNHLSTTIALYLYGRSFFLEDQPVAEPHREAVDYWIDQAKRHWLRLSYRQSQAHLAVALKRLGHLDSAKGIVKSIKERSVSDEELGMYWRDLERSWWWYRAPIETQAMMIEVFDEVANDAQAVEDCKVWLLKQKQTQDWKTTKATADAIYALLLRGTDVLTSDALVEVALGGQAITQDKVEAGTGFYEQRFAANDIKPTLGEVSVRKIDEGVAWGSVHWQYLEDVSKITPYDGTPLKLTKQLYVKKNTPKGPTLEQIAGPIEVGDELVVRLVLRTDRDMEYVHLKDHRGSGSEPVNVISRYKYQDGLGYYESTRDTASHFFIDYLPKGTYVFEYSTRVQLRGQYQTGIAAIQCMYAPEFNSHSESLPIEVQ